jgi:hypothetical protein
VDLFGLVQVIDRLGQGVVIGLASAAHRRLDASLDEHDLYTHIDSAVDLLLCVPNALDRR